MSVESSEAHPRQEFRAPNSSLGQIPLSGSPEGLRFNCAVRQSSSSPVSDLTIVGSELSEVIATRQEQQQRKEPQHHTNQATMSCSLRSSNKVSAALSSAVVFAAVLLAVQDQLANSATVTSRKPKSDQNCTDHLQIIDRCSSLATYSFTTPFNQYPNNTNEMKASCDRITDGLKCLKIHGKCLSSIARRSLTSFTSARSRHSKKLCANLNDPKTLNFIKVGPCISGANKKALMVAEERQLISAIQMLALNTSMKWDDRFHSACCVAANYKTKAIKDLEPECAKLKETQEEMLNSMIGELLETACPEQSRLKDICSKLAKLKLPKEWRAVSLTGAALDLIVALADNPAA